jgi:hypothetical protein
LLLFWSLPRMLEAIICKLLVKFACVCVCPMLVLPLPTDGRPDTSPPRAMVCKSVRRDIEMSKET